MLSNSSSGQGGPGNSDGNIMSSNFKNLSGAKDKLDAKTFNRYAKGMLTCAGCSNGNMCASMPKAKSKAKPKTKTTLRKKAIRTKKEKLLSEKNII